MFVTFDVTFNGQHPFYDNCSRTNEVTSAQKDIWSIIDMMRTSPLNLGDYGSLNGVIPRESSKNTDKEPFDSVTYYPSIYKDKYTA